MLVRLATLALTGLTLTASAAPVITCDEPRFDFGTVMNQDSVAHTFAIRNSGDATLKISRVRPACGCTTAKLSSDTLPPGATVEISTRLSLRGRRGPQMKTIDIESNDPKTPRLRLELLGTIKQEVEVVPPHATFRISKTSTSNERERDLKVTLNTKGSHVLTGVDASGVPFCSATVTTNSADNSYHVKLTLPPDFLPEKIFTEGSLYLLTDVPKREKIEVRVAVHMIRDIIVGPPVLVTKRYETSAKPFNQQVMLRSRNRKPLKVTNVVTPSPRVTATVYAISDMLARVDFRVVPPTSNLEGKAVKIHVSQPGGVAEIIEVPFRLTN